MTERLTDEQLRELVAGDYGGSRQIAPLATECLALRAQAKELILEIGVRDGMISDLQNRAAELEAALKDVRIDFEMWHETTSIAKIDAALKDAPE